MRRPALSFFAAMALPLGVGLLFWLPALSAARGFFPAPLDDVYIHFDFARSLAEGHPFEWIPGNGYSSGETSPLYAVLLAVGWLVGFRGKLIGVWAAVLAVVALTIFVREVRALIRAPTLIAWLCTAITISVAFVDWTLFSGMEMATFAGALGLALRALARTRAPKQERQGWTLERAQWALGGWLLVLCLLRPEAIVLAGVFGVVAARGAANRSGFAALARVALPPIAVTVAVLGTNWIATERLPSAGAELKLLSSNPYLSETDRARVFVENVVFFAIKGLGSELSSIRGLWFYLPLLATVGIVVGSRRSIATACIIGAIAWTLLVSWNGNSPFHNFRYYTPALLLLLVAAALGASAPSRRGRYGNAVSFTMAAVGLGLCVGRFPVQQRFFRAAVANIRDQQIEVGARLAALAPPNASVLLGDAGAIPFVSQRPAIDALGLGGFKRLPFARAALHGEAATLELIERLAPNERPTYLALYPNWFREITSRFGTEIDRVTITGNVICGGPTKGIYLANWTALANPSNDRIDGVDEIDVGDVVSEAEHRYLPPTPHGGWTTLDIRPDDRGGRRFDGGRIIPAGTTESFIVRSVSGRARIRVRIDREESISMRSSEGTTRLKLDDAPAHAWQTMSAIVEVHPDEQITLVAERDDYRNYHVWIERL